MSTMKRSTMKRIIASLSAVAVLSATPAFASLLGEVAQDKDTVAQLVASPAVEPGAGNIVNGEVDGNLKPARIDGVRLAPYPDSERPAFTRDR